MVKAIMARFLPPRGQTVHSSLDAQGEAREQGDTAVVTERKGKTQKPKLWKVILHNDDFTTQEFVIHVLEVVFNKEPPWRTI